MISYSASSSVNRVSSLYPIRFCLALYSFLSYYILSSVHLGKVLRNILYWANGARFCEIQISQNIASFA